MIKGVFVCKDDKCGFNCKGMDDVLIDGFVVYVYFNMMMFFVDGGKIIDYIVEEGYYIVKNDFVFLMFNGFLKDVIVEIFSCFKFGGVIL